MEKWFGKSSQGPLRYGQNRNFQYGYNQYDRDSYCFHNSAPRRLYNRDHWQDTATQQPECSTKTVRFQDSRPTQDEENLSLSNIIRRMHGLSVHPSCMRNTCSASRTSRANWPRHKCSRRRPHAPYTFTATTPVCAAHLRVSGTRNGMGWSSVVGIVTREACSVGSGQRSGMLVDESAHGTFTVPLARFSSSLLSNWWGWDIQRRRLCLSATCLPTLCDCA
jgi:hypothetical protein